MKRTKQKRVGCLFGSFNPIHVGHLMVAEYMATQTDLDEVQLVVSPHNPLKDSRTLASENDRLEMCRMAVADNAALSVNDVEFGLPRPSFTIDTLEHLDSEYQDTQFVLIMGSDNLEIFDRWKRWKDIARQFDVYVYDRPGYDVSEENMGRINRFYPPMIDLSSTYIRKCLASGLSVRYLVPEKVREYIGQKGLFKPSI